MKDNSIISIQDMGAAGLTSSSVEMAFKGDLGLELNLDKVPCREENMTPYEMMLSESQERMLIILEDDKEEKAKEIFKKWDLDFVIIGKTTNTKNLILKFQDQEVAKIPISALSSNAPQYQRKFLEKKLPSKNKKFKDFKKIKLEKALLQILSSPNYSNKSWVTEQFDQMVMCDTVKKSGSDSSIIRIHGKKKAISVTVDSSAIYCKSHPFSGGKQIVCENWRNLISVGSKPIAITNCLNFGNPEDPKIMGEFADCVKGIKSACEFLDYPVVSGNVSFYNGTNKKNIYPTPVIGGVGLINELNKPIENFFKKEGSLVISIGKNFGHLTQSALFLEVFNFYDGPPPEVNLLNEKNNGEIVLKLIQNNMVNSVHDISSGGLIIALAEMSINSNLGLKINKPKNFSNLFEFFFSEDQGRYCLEIDQDKYEKVKKMLKENNIFHELIGVVQKEFFELEKEFKISANNLYKINNKWYYNY